MNYNELGDPGRDEPDGPPGPARVVRSLLGPKALSTGNMSLMC